MLRGRHSHDIARVHAIYSLFAAVLLTGAVQGDIDSHVILARRRGADWYLAGIHAAEQAVEAGASVTVNIPGNGGLVATLRGAPP